MMLLQLAARFWYVFVIAGLFAYGSYWHHEAKDIRKDFEVFKAQVQTAGEKARADAAEQKLKDAKAKGDADAENAATVARLNGTISRLRADADRARGSFVPPAPSGSKRTDLACFDRPQLESAIRGLVTEVRGFVDEGAKATVDLDTARRWAKPN